MGRPDRYADCDRVALREASTCLKLLHASCFPIIRYAEVPHEHVKIWLYYGFGYIIWKRLQPACSNQKFRRARQLRTREPGPKELISEAGCREEAWEKRILERHNSNLWFTASDATVLTGARSKARSSPSRTARKPDGFGQAERSMPLTQIAKMLSLPEDTLHGEVTVIYEATSPMPRAA